MKMSRCLSGLLLLAAVTATPLLGQEPSTPGSSDQAVRRPPEIAGLLTPEPVNKYGWLTGPCTVSVRCNGGATLGCSGFNNCWYRHDGVAPAFLPGFVQCDDRERVYCLS